jgi:indole-3-glycerol phosphate synthase
VIVLVDFHSTEALLKFYKLTKKIVTLNPKNLNLNIRASPKELMRPVGITKGVLYLRGM